MYQIHPFTNAVQRLILPPVYFSTISLVSVKQYYGLVIFVSVFKGEVDSCTSLLFISEFCKPIPLVFPMA